MPLICCAVAVLPVVRSPAGQRIQMEGRYCIVTGSNAGIGKEIAAGLMQQGGDVVMACRNMQQCAAAREELQQRNLKGSCECSRLDLADQQSIRSFAREQGDKLHKQQRHLGVLVNNAGVMGGNSSSSSSPDGQAVDQHMLVNHLGPFLLTGLLLPHMTAGSRVVNVSSRAHFACNSLKLTDNNISSGSSWWFPQYACSKLCNILHTRELQERYQHSRGIIATSVSPGFVNTSIFRSLPSSLAWIARGVAPWVGRTPEEGAKVAVYAATSQSFSADKHVPLLLHDCKPMEPSAMARDRKLAADLWAASCRAVGWDDGTDSKPQQSS